MGGAMRAMVVAAALVALAGCESKPCSDTGMAQIMAQNFVRQELREPGSARFDRVSATQDPTNACSYTVVGRVTARNGFGGVSSNTFLVELLKVENENMWRRINLVMQ